MMLLQLVPGWVVADAVTGGLCVLGDFHDLYMYIYMGWGGVGWGRGANSVLTTTSLILR